MFTPARTFPSGITFLKRFWRLPLALAAAGFAIGAPAAQATTRTVPSQFSRIQDAIDASSSGDTIDVLPGTYTGFGNVNLNVGSKNLVIESTGGSDVTFLDNSGGDSTHQIQTLTVQGGQSNSMQLHGFTIKNSYHSQGGAITVIDSNLVVIRCVFLNNSATSEGGAIAVISNNAASGAVISQCSFLGNQAGDQLNVSGFGGAIECIANNPGLNQVVQVLNCVFDTNTASYDGGAIDVSGFSATSPKVSVINSTFTKNSAWGFVDPSSTNLLPAADATHKPGAASAYNGLYALTNCVLYGDSSPTEISTLNPGATANHCDISQTGYAGVNGNINAPPNFNSAASTDPTMDNLRPQINSPLIDLGLAVATAVPAGGAVPGVDRDNWPRYANADIGAYEFLQPYATAQTVTTPENAAVAITLKGIDRNTPARPLTFAKATNPAHGFLTGTAPNLTYTPVQNFYGVDSFTYTSNNGLYTSAPVTVTINVSYLQPILQSVTSNATVGGGLTITVRALLQNAAPDGGVTVSITSSNTAAMDNGSIFIPAGLATATAALPTHAVAADTPVTLSGYYNGVTKTDNITVQPTFQAITLNAASGFSGVAVNVGVSLYAPAPTGGVVVNLSSSDTTLVPANTTLTIPAGSYGAYYQAIPATVGSDTPITITATLGATTKTANYTVKPPMLYNFTAPATVAAGLSFTATATLQVPAPAGGASITVASSSAVAGGGTITIPAGQKVGSITLTSTPVNADTPVVLTATYGSVSKTANVNVQASFQQIRFSTTTVVGGHPTGLGVILNGPAPAGGITVTLSSSDTAMLPPGTTLTIPAGASSLYRYVTPSAVASDTTLTASATLGSVTKSGSITVTAH